MSIPAERLREGEQILVRGKVSFSRVAKLIEGEALTKSIEQARQRGSLYPTTVPHTTINLVDAQVLPANPAAASVEEQFVHEKIFTYKNGENTGHTGFGVDNKSNYLPTVLEMDPENPGQYRQLVLERDLASGLDVTLVLKVYKPAGYEKRGLGIEQIVLHEPVKYYASGLDTAALAARGIVVNGPIRSVTGADSPAIDSTTAASAFAAEADLSGFAVPANTQVNASGLPVPTPGAQGVIPAPSLAAQAFPLSTPAPAAVAAAPVTPLAPAPVAPVAVAPVQLAAPVETAEQTIARLQQQIAEQAAAAAASGGASAFDVAPAGGHGPWDVPGQGPAAYQG